MYDVYHILDRDDGHDDGHDEGGSKAYPSRTTWGAAYSLEEKHPHLFETRYGVKAYNYWNGYTLAQIKLMTLDVPVISYGKKGKVSGVRGAASGMTAKDAEDMWKQWEQSRGGKTFKGRKDLDIGEIFK